MAKENTKVVTKSFAVNNTHELEENTSEAIEVLIRQEAEKGREVDVSSIQVSISSNTDKIIAFILANSNKKLLN